MKELLNIHNDDFILWKEEKYGETFYHISIEGYLGFDKIEDCIDLYSMFLKKLKKYLVENKYPIPNRSYKWKTIYLTRSIEVCYEYDCYWVFLDGYESTEIWDTYYYLEDVINQLKEIKI